MSKRHVVLIAAALSLIYFLIEFVYIQRLPLVMDEFDGANEAYQLLHLTPYRDYQPYKTVLGYYVEVPPLLLTANPWTGLMLSKIWLALINTVTIFASTMSLAAIFSPVAALLGQVLLIFVTTFLERSSELRVDMLTAWAGLASFLLLLRHRWLAAGILAGVSFLVSQKGIYYIAAANVAAGSYWLWEKRDARTFRSVVLLNAGALATIAVYVAFWSLIATPSAVINTTFFRHGMIALTTLYDLEQHWTRTLTRNPLFYWGALAAIMGLIAARWRERAGATHFVAAVYGAAIFALCRWHKQPWPYFFVILIPSLMVVHVAALDLITRVPQWRKVALTLIVVLGIGWPLTYMPGILERDHRYQQHVIGLARSILDPDDTYLAGNDLIYDRRQAHVELRRLAAPWLEAMRQWPPERLDAVIADLERTRPKLIIDDTRMRLLPPRLRGYLNTRFDPLWSSVNAYAPLVAPEQRQFDIWFDGNYRVEPNEGEAIIDGTHYQTGAVIALQRGSHRNDTTAPVRLRLQPARMAEFADPAMRRRRLMFARAYTY